jgi:hypothetical protein
VSDLQVRLQGEQVLEVGNNRLKDGLQLLIYPFTKGMGDTCTVTVRTDWAHLSGTLDLVEKVEIGKGV